MSCSSFLGTSRFLNKMSATTTSFLLVLLPLFVPVSFLPRPMLSYFLLFPSRNPLSRVVPFFDFLVSPPRFTLERSFLLPFGIRKRVWWRIPDVLSLGLALTSSGKKKFALSLLVRLLSLARSYSFLLLLNRARIKFERSILHKHVSHILNLRESKAFRKAGTVRDWWKSTGKARGGGSDRKSTVDHQETTTALATPRL